MSELVPVVVRTVSTVIQFVGVAYAALVAWLMSIWMVDDSWAERASAVDWWLTGGKRALVGLFGATIVGGVLLVVNRALVHWNLASPTARPFRVALLGASVVGVAAIVGAIMFAIQRPFM